jgi:hypothetical protein
MFFAPWTAFASTCTTILDNHNITTLLELLQQDIQPSPSFAKQDQIGIQSYSVATARNRICGGA